MRKSVLKPERRVKRAQTAAVRAATAGSVNLTPPLQRAGADDDNWDQRLGFLMHDVSRLRRTVFDEYVRPLKVTRSQWWVLGYLGRHDGMTQSDLANVLEVGKAALGSLLDRLEAANLIHRGTDGSDLRVKRVFLSPAGAQLNKKMLVLSHELSERVLKGLGESERHMLVELLSRIKTNLRQCQK